jgi:hypothetical protein
VGPPQELLTLALAETDTLMLTDADADAVTADSAHASALPVRVPTFATTFAPAVAT